MPLGLQHCGLIVSDLERSRQFYGEALGLPEVPRPANFTFAGAWFELIVWGVATLTWRITEPGSWPARTALVIMATSGIRTLFRRSWKRR